MSNTFIGAIFHKIIFTLDLTCYNYRESQTARPDRERCIAERVG